ncbi:MAG: insulinase family protein [Proteobacteria bacterium]|nr:insulinase family protein [Pseudomonadota bacterium]
MSDFSLPEIPPAKLFQHATPEILALDNGIPLWYGQNPMVPLMSMRVVFTDGATSDPADKSGLSSMTAELLKEGAAGKSAQQLSDEVEFLGATLTPSITQDSASIYLQSMTQFFEKGVDILSDIWLKPDFTPESFQRIQKIAINGLKQREDAPAAIAKLASNQSYFGDNHPYSRSTDGYISTIQAITLDDVKSRYKTLFSPAAAAFIAVGSMPAEDVRALLNDRFGKLELGEKPVPVAVPDVPAPALRLTIVDKPDAPQTVIRIYQPAVKATDMKTLTWQFVNIPFGGSFTSRLMQNIREDKGFSYGANSAVSAMKQAGVMLSTSAVATEVTGAALHEFLYELGRLPKGDFTQEEFERARETWKSELVQSFETQSGVLNTISGLYLNNKPVDAINGFARELQNYTLDQFNGIAREFPTVEQADIVLVGDKKAILEQLEGMDLPAPVFRDTEGRLIK